MIFAFIDILRGADLLAYPLGICSLALVYIICERSYALRGQAVLPEHLIRQVLEGKLEANDANSVLGRVISFARQHPDDPDATKAFARLEVARMERGLPYLDVIYSGAPLLGLTGTIWSLIRVFSSISGETGLPDPVKFTSGVSLALSATLLGLLIAVPALVGVGILQRRVDRHAAELDVLLERILTQAANRAGN